MSTLKQLSNDILTEKNTKIIPENIKKDVQIFDITGAYEGSGGGSGIKKYDSISQMRADTTAEIGDLGVVFGTTTVPIDENTIFSSLVFDDTVVIPEIVNEWTSEAFRNVGSGTEYAECYANIYNENNIYTFTFSGNSSSGEIDEVKYTSQDGLNFTKVSGDKNVDIGINVKRFEYESTPFNTVFSYFLKTETNDFQGLYTYTENIPNDNKFKLYDISAIDFSLDTSSTSWYINGVTLSFLDRILEVDKIQACIDNYINSHTAPTHTQGCVFIGLDDEVYYVPNNTVDLAYNENKEYIGSYIFWRESFEVYQLDLDNGTCTLSETISSPSSYIKKDNYSTYYYTTQLKTKTTSVRVNNGNDYKLSTSYCTVNIVCGNTSKGAQAGRVSDLRVLENTYINAKTQLSASSDYVLKDKVFMGSNQVETGTLTNNVSSNFADSNAEIYGELLGAYQNMSPIVISNRSEIDESIKAIPIKLDGTSLLDLSHMNNAYGVFMGCRYLKYVPTLNISNTDYAQSLFYECTSLVEVSNFDTSNINVGYSMFYNCYSLKSIPNIDTSKMNDMHSMFWRCSNITSLPELNTSNVTNMQHFCRLCYSLENLPALNTSKVTDMGYAFIGCESLQNIPLLSTSNVNTMPSVFKNCFNLTNDSLNNILSICASATKINSSNRTLNYIGLSQNQANICKNLSNYSTFTAAGWTTGF